MDSLCHAMRAFLLVLTIIISNATSSMLLDIRISNASVESYGGITKNETTRCMNSSGVISLFDNRTVYSQSDDGAVLFANISIAGSEACSVLRNHVVDNAAGRVVLFSNNSSSSQSPVKSDIFTIRGPTAAFDVIPTLRASFSSIPSPVRRISISITISSCALQSGGLLFVLHDLAFQNDSLSSTAGGGDCTPVSTFVVSDVTLEIIVQNWSSGVAAINGDAVTPSVWEDGAHYRDVWSNLCIIRQRGGPLREKEDRPKWNVRLLVDNSTMQLVARRPPVAADLVNCSSSPNNGSWIELLWTNVAIVLMPNDDSMVDVFGQSSMTLDVIDDELLFLSNSCSAKWFAAAASSSLTVMALGLSDNSTSFPSPLRLLSDIDIRLRDGSVMDVHVSWINQVNCTSSSDVSHRASIVSVLPAASSSILQPCQGVESGSISSVGNSSWVSLSLTVSSSHLHVLLNESCLQRNGTATLVQNETLDNFHHRSEPTALLLHFAKPSGSLEDVECLIGCTSQRSLVVEHSDVMIQQTSRHATGRGSALATMAACITSPLSADNTSETLWLINITCSSIVADSVLQVRPYELDEDGCNGWSAMAPGEVTIAYLIGTLVVQSSEVSLADALVALDQRVGRATTPLLPLHLAACRADDTAAAAAPECFILLRIAGTIMASDSVIRIFDDKDSVFAVSNPPGGVAQTRNGIIHVMQGAMNSTMYPSALFIVSHLRFSLTLSHLLTLGTELQLGSVLLHAFVAYNDDDQMNVTDAAAVDGDLFVNTSMAHFTIGAEDGRADEFKLAAIDFGNSSSGTSLNTSTAWPRHLREISFWTVPAITEANASRANNSVHIQHDDALFSNRFRVLSMLLYGDEVCHVASTISESKSASLSCTHRTGDTLRCPAARFQLVPASLLLSPSELRQGNVTLLVTLPQPQTSSSKELDDGCSVVYSWSENSFLLKSSVFLALAPSGISETSIILDYTVALVGDGNTSACLGPSSSKEGDRSACLLAVTLLPRPGYYAYLPVVMDVLILPSAATPQCTGDHLLLTSLVVAADSPDLSNLASGTNVATAALAAIAIAAGFAAEALACPMMFVLAMILQSPCANEISIRSGLNSRYLLSPWLFSLDTAQSDFVTVADEDKALMCNVIIIAACTLVGFLAHITNAKPGATRKRGRSVVVTSARRIRSFCMSCTFVLFPGTAFFAVKAWHAMLSGRDGDSSRRFFFTSLSPTRGASLVCGTVTVLCFLAWHLYLVFTNGESLPASSFVEYGVVRKWNWTRRLVTPCGFWTPSTARMSVTGRLLKHVREGCRRYLLMPYVLHVLSAIAIGASTRDCLGQYAALAAILGSGGLAQLVVMPLAVPLLNVLNCGMCFVLASEAAIVSVLASSPSAKATQALPIVLVSLHVVFLSLAGIYFATLFYALWIEARFLRTLRDAYALEGQISSADRVELITVPVLVMPQPAQGASSPAILLRQDERRAPTPPNLLLLNEASESLNESPPRGDAVKDEAGAFSSSSFDSSTSDEDDGGTSSPAAARRAGEGGRGQGRRYYRLL